MREHIMISKIWPVMREHIMMSKIWPVMREHIMMPKQTLYFTIEMKCPVKAIFIVVLFAVLECKVYLELRAPAIIIDFHVLIRPV